MSLFYHTCHYFITHVIILPQMSLFSSLLSLHCFMPSHFTKKGRHCPERHIYQPAGQSIYIYSRQKYVYKCMCMKRSILLLHCNFYGLFRIMSIHYYIQLVLNYLGTIISMYLLDMYIAK